MAATEHTHPSSVGHHHAEAHGEDFTAINKAHWDEFASRYTEQQWQRDMISQITTFLQSHASWTGVKPTDRVLDYACGPGTITNAFGARAAEYQGIDLSDKMVEAYNARFQLQSDFNATAVVGNLITEGDSLPEHFSDPKFFNFDVAAIGLGFHHFENLELCLQRLTERIKPGGTLIIVDFLSHEPEERFHKIVAHHGFSQGQIKRLFEEAGLVDVDIVVMDGEVLMHERLPRKVFAARGRKPKE
ncbi:hypothetical protein DV737_g127, partial [Chaetothyriales sp. CBS 132003]